jgi:glycosyltransferase involved in cell wall biosynthesis
MAADFGKEKPAPPAESSNMKIVILASTSWNLYNSRLDLVKELCEHQHDIVLLAPQDECSRLLVDEGYKWVDLPMEPRGKKILQELATIVRLIIYYRKAKPDLVNHYTPKGVIYGSIAAKLAGIDKVVNTITGLGYVYSGNASKVLNRLVTFLYRISLKNTTTIFQNPDNRDFFCQAGIVSEANSHLVRGSGIDMNRFQPSSEPENDQVVILPARFVEEKGVRTFVNAAEIVKSKKLPIRFVLVGKIFEDHPTSIKQEELTGWVSAEIVEWWGWHTEMEKIYPLTNVVCLPTYYQEGIPKALIEAAACGRPLIATNVPGCREIVQEGVNGFLIPPRDPAALAEAVIKLMRDPELREKMGERSREIVSSNYSIETIINKYFEFFEIEF